MSEPSKRAVAPWRTPAIVGVALGALAIVTFTDALRLTVATGPGVGPAAAMKLIAAMLALLSLAHLAQAWKKRDRSAPAPATGEEAVNPVALAWVLGGLAGQILALSLGAGFILSSAWLFVATAKGFGRRFRSIGPLIGLALSLAVYAFFTQALSLSLPAGPLERLLFG